MHNDGREPRPFEYAPGRQTIDRGNFYTGVFDAFFYPLRKDGLYILLGGTLFFGLLQLIAFIPFVGLIPGLLAGAYMTAAMMRVISSSADGDDELPDWPEMTELFGDVLAPWFRWTFTFLFCLGPAVWALIWSTGEMALILGLVGLVYLPMGLIAVSLHQSILALNPLLIVPAIAKIPLQYALAYVMVLVATGLGWALQAGVLGASGALSFVLLPLVFGIGLYITFVQMRILGLLYFHNDEQLNWFGEANRFA